MTEDINIEYVTDKLGNKKAVQIPLKQWERIEQALKSLNDFRNIKSSLKSGFVEVEQIRKGKLPKKTLKEFLGIANVQKYN